MLQHPTNGNPPTLFLVLRGWIFAALSVLLSNIMFNEKSNGYPTIALWLLFWYPPSMAYCNISFKAELLKSLILHKMTLIPLHIHLRGKNRNVIESLHFLKCLHNSTPHTRKKQKCKDCKISWLSTILFSVILFIVIKMLLNWPLRTR